MLADQFLEAAMTAKNTHAVDEIARLTWKAQVEGHLAYAEAEAVSGALQARRTAFAAGRELRLASPVLGPPRPPRRRPRSPDRQASIERRRRQAAGGVVPSKIAANFTQGENAVLAVIGRQCQRGGACTLPVDAIAALAGVCRTTTQNALRAARLRGLLQVKERRIPRRKSLTNVITVVSPEWKGWLRLENIGFKNMSPTGDKIRREEEIGAAPRQLVRPKGPAVPAGRGSAKRGAGERPLLTGKHRE
jgi:hypothetical protein